MRSGVIILEILIGTLIAALLSTALLATIMQVSFAQKRVSDITSEYIRAATAFEQVQRDINGAFIPTQAEKKPEPKKKTPDQKTGDTKKKPEEEKEEPAPKPIDKVFYGQVKENRFELLTCITNNPLEIYIHAKNSKPKPRIVRVIYRLEQDPKRKKSYRLMRQEGIDLSFASYAKDAKQTTRSYEVIEGVAEFSVQYLSMDTQKNDDKESKAVSYKKSNQWGGTQNDVAPPTLPYQVEIKLVLWDMAYEKTVPFSMTVPIYAESKQGAAHQDEPELDEKAAAPEVKKDEANPEGKPNASQSDAPKGDASHSDTSQGDMSPTSEFNVSIIKPNELTMGTFTPIKITEVAS